MYELNSLKNYVLERVSPSLLDYLTEHTSIYWTIWQYSTTIRHYLFRLCLPLLHRLQTSPDLASIALLLVALYISLQVLGILRRAVMFWVRMSVRAAFWGLLLAAAGWVYGRGIDGVVEDLGEWFGTLAGLWSEEYQKYDQWDKGGRQKTFGGKKRLR